MLLLIILILILLGLIVLVGAALHCKGSASVGDSQSPDHGVINVEVSSITCRSFTVDFETATQVTEVYGTIHLTDEIAQTITVTYVQPATAHAITFSNGSVGLQSDHWYSYDIMGRDSFDHDPGAEIEFPFVCKTAKCCWDKLLPVVLKLGQVRRLADIPKAFQRQ